MPQSPPINWAEFDRLLAERGWNDAEAARQLGIGHPHLTNLRAGKSGPGRKVVDALVAIWGPEHVYGHLLTSAART